MADIFDSLGEILNNIVAEDNVTEPMVLNDNSGTSQNNNTYSEKQKVESKENIIIVIDPGHGGTSGNTGSVYRKSYFHKVKSTSGEPEVDTNGKYVIVETLIDALPDYVYNEVRITDDPTKWKWATKVVEDETKTERQLVWDVSNEILSVLQSAGYSCYLTRTNERIQGTEDRSLRTKFASDLNADYFISIHADGSLDYTITGAHTIFREGSSASYNNAQREFAEDLFKKYTIVSILSKSPDKRNDLQVLSPTSNSSKRKSLVELGYVTNTNDVDDLFSNINTVAIQIAQGIEINICKNYVLLKKQVVGYKVNGKIYKDIYSALTTKDKGNSQQGIVTPEEVYEYIESPITPSIN